MVRECLTVVEAIGVPGCKGHKHEPLIVKWSGMDWYYRMCPNDLVHDTKFFVEMLCKIGWEVVRSGVLQQLVLRRRTPPSKPNKRHIPLDVNRHQRSTSVSDP